MKAAGPIIRPEICKKLAFFLQKKARYKVAWGGRGGRKSWDVAAILLTKALSEKIRILCAREIQNSIKESVHRLFVDTMERLEIRHLFDVTDNGIICKVTGSEFGFKGLRSNRTEIKGWEGADIAWVEEAQIVSDESWQYLIPTIRKPDSEIWVTFNPIAEDDPTYLRFVKNPPTDSIVQYITYMDNPSCPKVLIDEANRLKQNDEAEYKHVWLGEPSGVGSRVWPAFNQSVHVRDFDFTFLANVGNLYMAMDPHTVYYPACVWMAKIPKGNSGEFYRVVYNEFPFSTMFDGKLYHEIRNTKPCTLTLRQLAVMFQTLDCTMGSERIGATIRGRALDTRFAKASGARSWATKTDGMVVEWSRPENGGLTFQCPAERTIDAQRDRVRKFLEYNEDMAINALNEPLLYVMPHCRNTIASMNFHRFDLDRNTEGDKYKDFSDAIRICLAMMDGDRYADPLVSADEPPARYVDYVSDRLSDMPIHESAMV